MTLATQPIQSIVVLRRPRFPETGSISPFSFQRLTNSFFRNSFPLIFIQTAPGGWGSKSETQAKLNPILLQRSTFKRSNALTSLESHPCAIVPANSHGITSLYKNIGEWGGKWRTIHHFFTQNALREGPLATALPAHGSQFTIRGSLFMSQLTFNLIPACPERIWRGDRPEGAHR